MLELFIKRGDTLPAIETIISGDNSALDLTNVTGVYFVYRRQFTGTAVIRTGSVLSAPSGIVTYSWSGSDVTTPGPYYGEWRLIYTGGGQRSYPNNNYINFYITSGLV